MTVQARRAAVRAFADHGTGRIGPEMAPGGLMVVLTHGADYRVGVGDGPLLTGHGGFLIGAQSRYGRSQLAGTARGVQIDLPWWVAVEVFGPMLADVADSAVAAADLPGTARLTDRLTDRLADTAPVHQPALVRRWLQTTADTAPTPDPTAVRALRRIADGASGVAALAAELDCSRSVLHRKVRAATGLPPTALLRVARLHRLLAAARGGSARAACTGYADRAVVAGYADRAVFAGYADRAVSAGYADHAHLCHETRALADRTPAELLGRTPVG